MGEHRHNDLMGDACSRMKEGKVEISEIQVNCDTRGYRGKGFPFASIGRCWSSLFCFRNNMVTSRKEERDGLQTKLIILLDRAYTVVLGTLHNTSTNHYYLLLL